MLLGTKLAVTPLGTPVGDNATADLNPFFTALVSVIAIELPLVTLALVALDVSVKPGAGAAVSVNVRGTVRARLPPVPAMVSA
jgi:hypothetical protein